MKMTTFSFIFVALLFTTGCVTKGTHEATLSELGKTQDLLVTARSKISKQDEDILSSNQKISRTNSSLAKLQESKATLLRELETSQELVNSSNAKILTLQQIEAETKKRNEIYAKFVRELQKMIDGGELTVSIEKGRIVINLPDNVLFASGKSALNWKGKVALRKIANVLKEFSDRSFQVEGHTDNVPMISGKYKSNWELSASRALSVVHLMIKEGVEAKNLSAAGFGEFKPRAHNDGWKNRALNRRIEIVMLPNLEILSSELPKVVN